MDLKLHQLKTVCRNIENSIRSLEWAQETHTEALGAPDHNINIALENAKTALQTVSDEIQIIEGAKWI